MIELHPHTAFTEESEPKWTDGGDPALWTDPARFELQPVSDEDLKSSVTEEASRPVGGRETPTER